MEDQSLVKEKINTKFVIIKESMLNGNPWIQDVMTRNDIYILRPDRHIFGSTSDKITFNDLTEDLKKRLRF